MPTGYTHAIENGNLTSVKQYIINCSGAFGAHIMSRDSSEDLPTKYEPSDYHVKALEKARNEFEELRSMTEEDIAKKIDEQYARDKAYNQKCYQEHLESNKRYDEMYAKVLAWEIPSEEHTKLKEFCLNQIEISKSSHMTEYYLKEIARPKLTVEQWVSARYASLTRDIEYHTNEHEAEVKRVNERNEWIAKLLSSLEGLE